MQKSSYRLLAPKIELKLVKKMEGIKWGKIEGDEEGGALPGAKMGECRLCYPADVDQATMDCAGETAHGSKSSN